MPVTRPRDRVVFSGTVSFTLVKLLETVTFPSPMPDTSYKIYWNTNAAVSANVSITNKTVDGFTIVLGVGLSMTMDWLAVEQIAL